MGDPRTGGVIVEVCVESVESAIEAQEGGASRVELCRDLHLDGCTPDPADVRKARSSLHIPLHVLVRPRPGDAVYDDVEVDAIRRSILEIRDIGADGVVVGAATHDGSVDRAVMERFIVAAGPMSVTFHRAFDALRDPFTALDELIGIGVDRVLTSGAARSAEEGRESLRQFVLRAEGRAGLVAAGNISKKNVLSIIRYTGVSEVHLARGVSHLVVPQRGGSADRKILKVDRELVRDFMTVIAGIAT